MARGVIGVAELKQYQEQGFVLVKGMFDAQEIGLLHRAAKEDKALDDRTRVSNPPSQAAEPVVKCGYGSSGERSHGKTTDTGRDSADCVGVCNERHATQ